MRRRCVVLNPLVSEENWDQVFPDNQLVAFSKYLTKQMASMCVCEGESNGGGAMMLDFVKAGSGVSSLTGPWIPAAPQLLHSCSGWRMVRLVIVYFVSLSCLSNLVLMRMCSCTLRSGFLFLLSTSEATREKDKHEKYLSDVCNITAEFIICSKTPYFAPKNYFKVFLNCWDNVGHEYPRSKQINRKLLHPEAFYSKHVTSTQNIQRLSPHAKWGGCLRVCCLAIEKRSMDD